MTTLATKELMILAVHGDVNRESVQRILDEQSARAPAKGYTGPHDPAFRGPFLDKADWPVAEANGLIVAIAVPTASGGKQDETRLELALFDFVETEAVKAAIDAGKRIRLTLEVID